MDNIVINDYYNDKHYEFKNKPLGYNYDALEPYIDEKTMILHHDRHLQSYIDNLNSVLKEYPAYQKWSLTNLICLNKSLPEQIRVSVMHNAGGAYNHMLYFDGMTDNIADKLAGESLKQLIAKKFGSIDAFCRYFKREALSVFGSGYVFLATNERMKLEIISERNQMTPLSRNLYPLLNIDVWEHSYYLKHYNNRADYIDDWFKTVNWKNAASRLNHITISQTGHF